MSPATFVVRVWLPDRPGALGHVASRIGAARGDVTGIEILERGGGRAVDEIMVELPDAGLVSTLVREINEVDDIDVEEVRPIEGGQVDPWIDALDTAAQLVGASSADELLEGLLEHAHRGIGASWAAIVDLDGASVRTSRGSIPSHAWLHAFIEGSMQSARAPGANAPRDVTWAPLPAAGVALILGRDGTALRAKERHQAAALARIADAWLRVLPPISHRAHPPPTRSPSAATDRLLGATR